MVREKETLVPRATVEEMVCVYERAEGDIRAGCQLISDAERRLTATFNAGVSRGVDFRDPSSRASYDFSDPVRHIAHLREQIWEALVDRLQVRQMMSIAKAKELRKWLDEEAGGEAITVESVIGFFKYYVDNLGNMLEEQVLEVYDFLRPRRDEYKTNSQYRIGKKVIVSYWVECRRYDPDRIHVNYRFQDHYVALQNVFQSLDGKGSISKGYRTELEVAIGEKRYEGETTYFRYRACKNGNLHLEFRRTDLVERFNQIAGKRFLGKGADDVAA